MTPSCNSILFTRFALNASQRSLFHTDSVLRRAVAANVVNQNAATMEPTGLQYLRPSLAKRFRKFLAKSDNTPKKRTKKKEKVSAKAKYMSRLPVKDVTYNEQQIIEREIIHLVKAKGYSRAMQLFEKYYQLTPESEVQKRTRLLKQLNIKKDVVFGAKQLEKELRQQRVQIKRSNKKEAAEKSTNKPVPLPKMPPRVKTLHFADKESRLPLTLNVLLCGIKDIDIAKRMIGEAVSTFGKEPVVAHKGIMASYAQVFLAHRRYREASMALNQMMKDRITKVDTMTQPWFEAAFDARFPEIFITLFENKSKWSRPPGQFGKNCLRMFSYFSDNLKDDVLRARLEAIPQESFSEESKPKQTAWIFPPRHSRKSQPKEKMIAIALSRGISINHPVYRFQRRPRGKGLFRQRASTRSRMYMQRVERGEITKKTSKRRVEAKDAEAKEAGTASDDSKKE
eukprot:CAMPEP_0117447028 /NCGR_PEP_ID=MMETSP0759-20121206/6655_1 /TAXON_ID=63605 /ORGANISM="Percolomonas cosmopolitus, Strain WS" /LENGTH=453 /DNA_ID=CAMNT_0005239333 /DNA_START=78 /DNA_END=1439 /DNA_ORIENTATION=+